MHVWRVKLMQSAPMLIQTEDRDLCSLGEVLQEMFPYVGGTGAASSWYGEIQSVEYHGPLKKPRAGSRLKRTNHSHALRRVR